MAGSLRRDIVGLLVAHYARPHTEILTVPGSYQLGYLFVCALERICNAQSRSDTLLAFLREHFFDDLELASMILDDQCPMEELYAHVRAKLQAKVFELVGDPAAAESRVREWGDRQPLALPMEERADDFFRYGAAPGQEEQRAGYQARIHEFCCATASPVVSSEQLEEFLVLGRVLMPVGSQEFRYQGMKDDRLAFVTEDGTQLLFPAAALATAPAVGGTVTISMIVNVASPACAVVLRWDGGFGALSVTGGETSKKLIEEFYSGSATIGLAVNAGQTAIDFLRRVLPGGDEPLDAFVEDYLESDNVALDVLQIYRAPIVRAFSNEQPELFDSRWRTEAFRRWEPNGISTILESSAMLDEFLKVCGMPVSVEIDREVLADVGLTKHDAMAVEEELFKLLNGSTLDENQAIAKTIATKFESRGLQMFGESPYGRLASLV